MRIHQGGVGSLLPAERCGWTPPVFDACLKTQYVTAAEHAAQPAEPPLPLGEATAAAVCAAAAGSPARASSPGALLPDAAPATAAQRLVQVLGCFGRAADVPLTPALLAPLGLSVEVLSRAPLMAAPHAALLHHANATR